MRRGLQPYTTEGGDVNRTAGADATPKLLPCRRAEVGPQKMQIIGSVVLSMRLIPTLHEQGPRTSLPEGQAQWLSQEPAYEPPKMSGSPYQS